MKMEGEKLELPNSWVTVKLGDFVENEKGKKPKNESKAKTVSHTIPYVDIQAFEENVIRTWTDGVGCRTCYETDFLMVWDGSRSGLVGKGMNGALGSTLVRIYFPSMVNDYAFYFLQSKYQQINTRAKGVGIPHVDPALLWNYDFPIAPLNEQHRIVAKIEELFSELDKGIENLKTAQAQLKVYRQALLKHAFEGKLTAQWRAENQDKLETAVALQQRIQQERAQRYQQQLADWQANGGSKPKAPKPLPPLTAEELAELPELPEGWGWVRLASIVTVISGYAFKSSDFVSTGVPVVKIANVGYSEFVDKDQEYLDNYFLQTQKDFLISPDDFLLALTRPITNNSTKVCRYPKNAPVALLNQRVSAMKNVEINPEFLYSYFGTSFFKESIRSKFSETLQPNLSPKDLEACPIPICSITEQMQIFNEIESRLSEIDQLELTIAYSLQQAESLRQSILKRAFSGQLVPQDPHDEPASALLARIRAEREQSDVPKRGRKSV